jgi:hypothetical protein
VAVAVAVWRVKGGSDAKHQDAPPRFGPASVFVGIICGGTRHRRSPRVWCLVANGGPERRIKHKAQTALVRRIASKWPNMSQQRPPHMPERCAGELPRYMTAVDSIYVGRFDRKFAAQRLFPSLSSWSPSCLRPSSWSHAGWCRISPSMAHPARTSAAFELGSRI